jgi:hypothetical protein
MNDAVRRTRGWAWGAATTFLLLGVLAGRSPVRAGESPDFVFESDTQGWTCPQNGSTLATTQIPADV